MIATPAYGGMVTSRHKMAAICTETLLRQHLRDEEGRNPPIIWVGTERESLVQRARNVHAAEFLVERPALSHLIFIDSDIEWDPLDILRLIAHDVDVVFGVYPKKCDELDFAFHPEFDANGNVKRNPETGALEIRRGSTGFMCIKRRVLEQMAEAYPRLKIRMDGLSDEVNKVYHAFFDAYVDDSPDVWVEGLGGVMWSEDYGFCNRWKALGGQIWADPEIGLNHIGQKIYSGKLSDLYESKKEAIPGTEQVWGWVVPKGDPWFVPALQSSFGRPPDAMLIETALSHVRDFDMAVDLGAHIGTWTRPLAGRFQKVLAVEPNEAMLPLLRANTDGFAGVQVRYAGAWDLPEPLALEPYGVNSGEMKVRAAQPGEPQVEGLVLDDLGIEHLGLLKIDVEGAEMPVLSGAIDTIRRCRSVVVVEENGDRLPSQWLEDLGMVEVARVPIAPNFPKDNVVMVWPDAEKAAA